MTSDNAPFCLQAHFIAERGSMASTTNGSPPRPLVHRESVLSEYDGDLDIDTTVQMTGMLWKKPFGGKKKHKWQRRFFVAKDGFLLYYAESEGKTFQKNNHFNIHPKGVIPLGCCKFEECVDGIQKFAIKIGHDHFKGEIVVGAESDEDCRKWIKAFIECAKVTWRNSLLGENVIIQLEEQSSHVAKEKQEVIDKLHEEASKLEVEKGRKQELEELAEQLEKEKKSIEEAAKELRKEKDSTDLEMKGTLDAMKQIEEEKMKLKEQTDSLQANLESLYIEKDLTAAQLQEREMLTKKLEEEKKSLEQTTTNLKDDLQSMEEHSKVLEIEKLTTEEKLRHEAEMAGKLKAEVRQISNTALSLEKRVEEVAQEKEQSVTAYQREKKRRINTEKRLRLAEDSLKRLDKALKESGIKIDIQIETDVTNLKKFFEDTIAEEQYEAEKLDIMRDALRSKATYNLETKRMEQDLKLDPPPPCLSPDLPPLSPEPIAPLSPDSLPSQDPDSPTLIEQNGKNMVNGNNMANGKHDVALENGTESINTGTNGDSTIPE